ncbi:hypothetical protein LINGRAHAP2_LOCUS14435 [Linum grandiflorum]
MDRQGPYGANNYNEGMLGHSGKDLEHEEGSGAALGAV